MRFLVDAQIPPALARWLVAQDHEAEHVMDCGLESATDTLVWEAALEKQAVIISKDEDFAIRSNMSQHGPPIVWLRIGNTSRTELLEWFAIALPQILKELEKGERLIEVL